MNKFVLVAAISLAAIFEFGNTSPVHPNEDKAALNVALLNEQTGITKSGHHDTKVQTKEAETTASGESQESQPLAQNAEIEKPKPPVETIKAPANYDILRVAANAAAKVYGWLTADKQPKKIKDQARADYDVERVAANAAAKVYGWLPADKQPKKIKDQARADYDVERVAAKAPMPFTVGCQKSSSHS